MAKLDLTLNKESLKDASVGDLLDILELTTETEILIEELRKESN